LAAVFETVAVAGRGVRLKPAKAAADKPATRGVGGAGARLRGNSEPRRTR
jgi:hypothetical protein